ncbi:hypothetical protein POPTR_005G130500v4 [Populus trichocarpa]|uniref:Uncharacterized protein n=1 Tax=Populus trichocarpa TaxID=3694 RepID=U5GC43_POPTR|nr:hypothetical protein POPTR_005G130500v4 [Populus trichocarpa]
MLYHLIVIDFISKKPLLSRLLQQKTRKTESASKHFLRLEKNQFHQLKGEAVTRRRKASSKVLEMQS